MAGTATSTSNNWNKSYGHNKWDNDWHETARARTRSQAYKNGNWNKYH